MGLFGLAVLSTARRRKEIGIRKALGASGQLIFVSLSGEYLKPVMAANLMAGPLAWYFVNRWLDDFAYRIDLSVTPFAVGAAMTVVVALGTVAYHTVSANLEDPVQALREE